MQLDAVGLAAEALQGEAGVESLGLCLFDESWHQGVVGLVAGRVKERLHRPVIAFARAEDGSLRGSARSVAGVNIRDALDSIAARHPDLIDKFGGHAMAAGVSLRGGKPGGVPKRFCSRNRRARRPESLRGVIYSDGALTRGRAVHRYRARAARRRPLGPGISRAGIRRRVQGARCKNRRRQTHENDSRACRAPAYRRSRPSHSAMRAACRPTARTARRVQLAYRLEINEFRGSERVQLNCQHVRLG